MKHITKLFFVFSIVLCAYIIVMSVVDRGITIHNNIANMTATITNEVVPYSTDYVYNESRPSTSEPLVLEKGINGLSLTYDGLNYKTLSTVKNEVIEIGTGKAGEYTGTLTGYGPDCPGCSLVGNVSCLTHEGTKHSLINDGVYYNDYEYGISRIIAADNSAFPCGTIINIENSNMEKFTAIVLDTGYTMRNAWRNGVVWIDVAFPTEKEAGFGLPTNTNTNFSVQRWGW